MNRLINNRLLNIRKPNDWFRIFLQSLMLYFLASKKSPTVIDSLYEFQDFSSINYGKELPYLLGILGQYGSSLALCIFLILTLKHIKFKKINLTVLSYAIFIFIFNIKVFDSADLFSSFALLLVPICLSFLSKFSSNPETNKNLRENFVLSLFIFSIMMIGVNGLLYFSQTGYHGFRFSGISYHPNALGNIIGISLITTLHMSFKYHYRDYKKTLLLVFFIIGTTILLESGSRGAILSLLVSLILYFIGLRKFKTSLFALIFLSLAVTYSFSDLNSNNLDRIFDSDNNRIEAFSIMWNSFLEYPFFGSPSGAGASENAILKSLGSTGITGGFFFLFFYVSSFCKSFKVFSTPRSNSAKDNSYLILSVITFFILFSCFFEGYTVEHFSLPGLILIYSILGISNNKP